MAAKYDHAKDSLFVYGTLVEASMRVRLLGREVAHVAARLDGYERGTKRHFFIAPKTGAWTAGLVLRELTEVDFRILDEYEDAPSLYTREQVEVVLDGGKAMRCWVYLPTGWARD
ncbi:MAG TPA: gamma-glutamylcyclotransferase family protein [Candidatus Binataceae bacterium]|nr:gamma-glutamylcyclotransferase family protein [Candidatus Binataceae bacterium]